MLKKSITYETFDGQTVTEDFYFNFSKAELVKMELSVQGGLKEHLEAIVAADNGKEIISEMENVVLGSYGVRSEDGKRFIKNQQLVDEFKSTEAYSVLFMELVTETDAAIKFVNGIMPKDLENVGDQDKPTAPPTPLAAVQNTTMETATPDNPHKLTRAELEAMDSDELKSGLATGKYILP